MGWKLQRNPGWETGWKEQMKKPLIVIGSFNNYPIPVCKPYNLQHPETRAV